MYTIWNFQATVAKNFQMQMEENFWLFLSFFFMFSIQDNWFLKLGYYTKSLVNTNLFYTNFTNTHFWNIPIPHLTL